jgi:Bacterial aa3 type cytochrome c oxidase subunit IV
LLGAVRRCPEISWAYEFGSRCPRLAIAVIPRQFWRFKVENRPVADHGEVAYSTADGNDYVAHEATYVGFLKLVKYGTIAVVIIVALMGIFLT